MSLDELPGARFLRGRMYESRILALLVILTFTIAPAHPMNDTRENRSGRSSLTVTSDSPMLLQESLSNRPRPRRRTRRRRNRNPVVRVITAPYRGVKAVGKSIGRGVRRLFGGRSRRRAR
ncbi:MAG: hypothetical protein H0V27_10665 [Pyrinomonadaceae bacterium]|nr:hypothetical protein [Pyrinomonadaceae bacterium]